MLCGDVLCDHAGCSRYNMTVEAGKTYRIRMINAGSLVFYTVCFAGHNVTIVAADSFPVTPLSVSCVDINLGQRYCHLLLQRQLDSEAQVQDIIGHKMPFGHYGAPLCRHLEAAEYDRMCPCQWLHIYLALCSVCRHCYALKPASPCGAGTTSFLRPTSQPGITGSTSWPQIQPGWARLADMGCSDMLAPMRHCRQTPSCSQIACLCGALRPLKR